MILAALSWPQASVYVALIISAGLILAVLIWSIFRTGQTAIRSETRQGKPIDNLRRDVQDLRTQLERFRVSAAETREQT